ncbi:MAG TPA: hypothetical protein EYO58_06065 [Flavobacteriales bacterium]|nr:hypothetical protein [Flavobacteriales bacterium]
MIVFLTSVGCYFNTDTLLTCADIHFTPDSCVSAHDCDEDWFSFLKDNDDEHRLVRLSLISDTRGIKEITEDHIDAYVVNILECDERTRDELRWLVGIIMHEPTFSGAKIDLSDAICITYKHMQDEV